MARIRTIKPEFWVDDQIVELSFIARLLFIGLWNFVDDDGLIEYKPRRIKMQVFPADNIDLESDIESLIGCGRLEVLSSDQGDLLRIVNWHRHQVINKRSKSRFTGLVPQSSRSTTAPVLEDSGLKGKEGKGREMERKGQTSSSDADASDSEGFSDDVIRLCSLLGHLIEANGNKVGTIGVTWWKAADRLMRLDGYTPEQVEFVLRWSQADEFWQGNILSMPKLREKFDALKAKAQAQRKQAARTAPTTKADQNAAEYHRLYGNGDNDERTRSISAPHPGVG